MRVKHLVLFAAGAIAGLSPAVAQGWRMQGSDVLDRADSNGDGFITRDEYARARDEQFTKLDRNGDGVVTKSDFGRLARFKPEAVDRIMSALTPADANRDGRISRAELRSSPMMVFTAGDADRDGRLSRQEMVSLQQRRQRN